jgi:hypothetical protein
MEASGCIMGCQPITTSLFIFKKLTWADVKHPLTNFWGAKSGLSSPLDHETWSIWYHAGIHVDLTSISHYSVGPSSIVWSELGLAPFFHQWEWLKCNGHGPSLLCVWSGPKAGIILRYVTFLALDIWCTHPPIIHPIAVGVSKWTRHFQPTTWEPRDLPLGETSDAQPIRTHSRCSPLKRVNSCCSPSNSRKARFENTYRSRPTWKWNNIIIHASDNIGVVFLSFFTWLFILDGWEVCSCKVETPYHDNDLIPTPINITTKWLTVNLKMPELHMGGFWDGGWQFLTFGCH